MKKLVGLLLVCGLFCGCSMVPAGYVGVKIYLLGGSKGVDIETLPVGRYWIGWNEELYTFPVFTVNYPWTKSKTEGSPNDESLTFQTKEGLSVNFDCGISYSLDPTKVSGIFQKYRKGVDELTDIVLRNAVRDAFVTIGSQYTTEEAYANKKGDLILKAKDRVKEQFSPLGINIENLYYIGDMRLPEIVLTALNSKIEAIQKAQARQNEVAAAEAEARKKVAAAEGEAKSLLAVAEAQAKANKLVRDSVSKELIQFEAIKRWDGKVPQVSAGNGIPFINIDTKDTK